MAWLMGFAFTLTVLAVVTLGGLSVLIGAVRWPWQTLARRNQDASLWRKP